MAKKVEKCLKRPLGHEECILELQVAVKTELLDPKLEVEEYAVKLEECKLEVELYAAELEECEHLEPLKLINSPLNSNISAIFNDEAQLVDVFCLEKIQRKLTHKSNSIIHFASENGGRLLQIQGKKDQLKHLIKDTLLKSLGHVKNLYKGKQKYNIIKVFNGIVKFKRDGVPSKRILQERDANKLLAEVNLLEGSCNQSEKILLPGMVEEIHQDVVKYWLRRYTLFSRFDQGMKLDEEGLFSVTPEEIAKQQAVRCGSGTVIDAFTGIGGNAIQFACMNFNVIAIDIDPKKIEYAQHNAEIYGVAHKIDFIVGDFFQLAPTLRADVIFLSPPWGGPEYIKAEKYDIETMLRPADGFSLFKLALSVAPSVAYFLPRTVDVDQLARLSWLTNPPLHYEIEKNYIQDELKAVTAYYGKIVG